MSDAWIQELSKEPDEPWLREAIRENDETNRRRATVEQAVKLDPGASAKNQANANRTGLPLDVVESDPQEADWFAKFLETEGKLEGTSHLKKQFENPEFAQAQHDNVDALLEVERSGKGFAASIGSATFGLSEGFYRIPESAGRYLDAINQLTGIKRGIGALQEMGLPEWLVGTPGGSVKKLIAEGVEIGGERYGPSQIAEQQGRAMETLFPESETLKRIAEKDRFAGEAFDKALAGDFEDLGEVLTDPESLASFVGQAIPSLVAMWATGGNMGVIAGMEALEVSSDAAEFEKMTGTEVDPVQFAKAQGQVALINTFLEKFGFEKIMGAKGILGVIGAGLGEMGTEMMQAFDTNLAIWWNYNKNKSLTEGVLQGGIGGFGAGVSMGSLRAIGQETGPDSGFSDDFVRADAALKNQALMDSVVEKFQNVEMEGRNKLQVKSFLDDVLGTENAVVIPNEDAAALFQSNPEIMEEMEEDTRDAIQEQLTTGQDIQIPTSEYVLHMSDIHSEIRDIVRNDIDGMNAQEANQWAEEGGFDQVVRDADTVLEKMEQDSEFSQQVAEYEQGMITQLEQAGRDPEYARKAAQLPKAFVTVASHKLGITPNELIERHPELGLRVQTTALEGVEGLTQAEQTEYQRAVAKGLPMDEASRKERAQEMGYDTQIFYHANTGGIVGEGFDANRLPWADPDRPFVAFWFSHEPSEFSAWSGGTGNTITPVRLRLEKEAPHEVWRKVAREVYKSMPEDSAQSAPQLLRERLVEMGYTHVVRGREAINKEELERTGETTFKTSTGVETTLKWEKITLPPPPPQYTEDEIQIMQDNREAQEKLKTYQALVIDMVMGDEEISEGKKKDLKKQFAKLQKEADEMRSLAHAANERAYGEAAEQSREVDSLELSDEEIGSITGYESLEEYESQNPEKDDIAVLDPTAIRSVNAAFDPDFADSGNLLAQSGLTQEEQTEYQQAVAKGLPMDQESRMARAGEMGYDTEQVWYHGTASDITGGFMADSNGLVFVALNPAFGSAFSLTNTTTDGAGTPVQRGGAAPNVVPVYINEGKRFDGITDWSVVEEMLDSGEISPPSDLQAKQGGFATGRDLLRDAVETRQWLAIERLPGFIDGLRKRGYESIILDEEGETTLAVFDPSQIRSVNAAFDPDFAESGNLLAQGPVSDAMAQYREEQEARPIVGEVKTPIQNKDGTYRRNAKGDITGAPEDVRTEAQITKIVNNNVDHMEDPLAQMPSSAEWYNVSGAAIRSVTHGDPQLMEKMVRSMALLSADNQVGGNTTGAVKAIYQLARGEVPAAGRYPNVFRERSETVLAAEDISLETPGASDKVVSFYRNLWDATFLSDKYYGSVTMDIWMARLYGYKTDTFSPAQYRFASMITKRIADAYNEKHDTSLSPDQVQAALWVYSRNRDKYGGNVGADISIEDRSAFDTYLNRATQNITFEAVPAVNSGQFPELHLATAEQKREYTKQAVRVILNEQGENELFNKIGVPLYRQTPSEGTFEGVVNPNEIFSIVSEKAAGVVDTGKADLAARVLQYIYTQNAVPWFQLDHTATGASQGVAIYHSAQPTPEMEEAFLEHLQTTQHIDADFTRVGDDYFLLNFTDLSNKAFKAKVLKAINTYRAEGMPGAELMEDIDGNVKARANYLADPRKGKEFDGLDWAAPEAVTALENEISNSGVPDLLGWARDRREAVGRLQADFRDENLVLHQSANVAPFDLAFEHEVVTPDQLHGYEEAHAPERAAVGLQAAAEGKGEPRRPPSVRREADGSFTVIDGRSGVTAAIEAGYTQIPVRIIDDVHDSDTGEVVPVTPEVEEFYNKAGRVKDKLDKYMEGIALKAGGIWKDTNLKGRRRAMWKVENEYKGDPNEMKDILRGTVSVNTLSDIEFVQNLIVAEHKSIKNKTEILNLPSLNLGGYKDVNLVIDFNGVKAEIQINTRDMLVAKHFGHDLYMAYRESHDYDLIKDLMEIEQKLYRQAYSLTRLKGGETTVDDALRVVRARANEVDAANERYGLSINFRKSDLDSLAPLWAAEPGGNFRGGSVSHAKQALLSKSSVTGTPSTSKSIADEGMDSVSNIGITSSESIAESGAYSQPERGQIQFTDQGALITLLENADLSTFLHESGHFFFEAYKTLALENVAIRADMDVLLDYIGIDSLETWNMMPLDQRREGHEKVARAFETYLFEGKAPSMEMQSLFDTFKSWLLQVYKSIRNLNAPLTDEVRQVFDRMLASEDMIREREVADNYQALFKSNEDGEMTEKQWLEYQNLDKAQQSASEGELTRRSLADLKWVSNKIAAAVRASESDIRAKRKSMKEEVTAELENSPVYRAIQFVKTGDFVDVDGNPQNSSQHKLDRDAFYERYPNYTLPRGWTEKDGILPDDLAEQFGFGSGNEMMEQMLSAAPIKQQIERVTDQRMLETYGDLNNPAKIQQAAEEAVHSDAHTKMLHTELTHLRKRTGVRGLLHKAAKALAERTINAMKIRRIKPWQYSRAEARAARESERALMKGDRESAAEHKRAQILQNHFWRAANNAQKKIASTHTYLKKFDRPGTRKNLDREYLDQIDALLEKVGLKKISQKEVERRKAFSEWYEDHQAEGVEVPKDYAERLKTHYTDMTFEELMGLRDNIKNIEHLARLKHQLKVGQEIRDYNEAMDEGRDAALAVNPQKFDPEDRTPERFERARGLFRQGSAWLLKVEFLAERLDGNKENGFWWNTLFRPLADAENTENNLMEEVAPKVAKLIESSSFTNMNRKIYINQKAGHYSWNQVFSMGLNWGNEGNRTALVAGLKDQQVSHDDVQRILNENFTQEDWNTVQQVWDLIDSYWPQIAELQKQLTGVVPEKVERTTVETPFGTIEGGYYPLVFDTRLSLKAFTRDQKMNVQEMLETNFLRPTTRKGHTIERIGSNGQPVKLDVSVITQHINNVIHDLSYREAILQVDKVIQDPRTRDTIWRIAGLESYEILRPWLAAVAQPNREMLNPGETIAKALRKNATIVNMGFKLTTGVVQPLGYSQAVDLLGEKWAMRGVTKFMGNPMKAKAMIAEAMEKSAFLRNRMSSFDRDINDAIKKVKKEKGVTSTMQQWAFKHIGFMDMTISVPIWHAGYEKGISENMSEADAIAMGDRAVRISQSSGSMKDLSRVQQGGEYQKLITMFYTYFNGYHNLMRRRAAIEGRKPMSLSKVMGHSMSFLYLTAIPAILSEIIVGRGPDDEEDEEWLSWMATQALAYPAMSVVGVRDITNSVVSGYGYELTPIQQGIKTMLRGGGESLDVIMGEGDETSAKLMLMSAGYIFGLPSRQLWTLIDNSMAMMEGERLEPAEMVMMREQRE